MIMRTGTALLSKHYMGTVTQEPSPCNAACNPCTETLYTDLII
jgi:hypothetical protein